MISRRLYFSILLTMIAVSLLFMGTQLGKEHWEEEEMNTDMPVTGLGSDTVWTGPEDGVRTERRVSGVVYIGSADSAGAAGYIQWARYAKRTIDFASSAEDKTCAGAELILVPGDKLSENAKALSSLMDSGVNVLCLSLPPAGELRENKELMDLLGIIRVQQESVRLEGMHLFGGFLLGGERIYRPENRREAKERQDLPLDTPWYVVRPGTETYLRGMLNDDDERSAEAKGLKNEDMPAIIWRHHRGSAELFAVNGPYMSDAEIAGGIVQAALSEIETTSIYPVVDAQLFSLLDFPALSDENDEVLLPIYGRRMSDISRNIILPGMVFLPNRYGIAITAFAAPQFDFSDEQKPQKELAEQFRKELHALDGELGLSLRARKGIDPAKQLAADAGVMYGGSTVVPVTSIWKDSAGQDMKISEYKKRLPGLRTVVTMPGKGMAPLDYAGDDVTLQRVTGNAATHTYMQDIRLICRETSMGYDSCYCDFSGIWYPQTDDDRWQKLADKVSSNLVTYRKPFEAFDRVTASECDAKIRRYLMIDYDYRRDGDEIELYMPLLLTESSFVLRLNGETVTEMEGGTWTRIEEDAFLLRVTSSYVHISVAVSEPLKTLSE